MWCCVVNVFSLGVPKRLNGTYAAVLLVQAVALQAVVKSAVAEILYIKQLI